MHSNEPVRNKGSTERSMCRTWAFYNDTDKNRELLLQLVHLNWKFGIYLSEHYVPSIKDAEYKPRGLKTVVFQIICSVLFVLTTSELPASGFKKISDWCKVCFQCGSV